MRNDASLLLFHPCSLEGQDEEREREGDREMERETVIESRSEKERERIADSNHRSKKTKPQHKEVIKNEQ